MARACANLVPPDQQMSDAVNVRRELDLRIDHDKGDNIVPKFTSALNKLVMPYIAVFWDIENVQVPKDKSAFALVHKIWQMFYRDHKEYDFVCVCDTDKESKAVLKELNLAQVTITYVDACNKNAADMKLTTSIRKFFELVGPPATLVLISADINFSPLLKDAQLVHKLKTVLIHSSQVNPGLTVFADECYTIDEIARDLPNRDLGIITNKSIDLLVSNLPVKQKLSAVKYRLQRLAANTGGKVVSIKGKQAIVRFADYDSAAKGKTRMNKESVLKKKISVDFLKGTQEDLQLTLEKCWEIWNSLKQPTQMK